MLPTMLQIDYKLRLTAFLLFYCFCCWPLKSAPCYPDRRIFFLMLLFASSFWHDSDIFIMCLLYIWDFTGWQFLDASNQRWFHLLEFIRREFFPTKKCQNHWYWDPFSINLVYFYSSVDHFAHTRWPVFLPIYSPLYTIKYLSSFYDTHICPKMHVLLPFWGKNSQVIPLKIKLPFMWDQEFLLVFCYYCTPPTCHCFAT